MKLKVVLLSAVLLASPFSQAFADTCRENIFGGQDCQYSDGTSSTSRSNIFGGQDTDHSK